MKKFKYYIPALIWMIFIFIMSHTNGTDSSNQSNFFVEIILKIIYINPETLSFLIRKAAHMSEYAILFLLIYYGISKTIAINHILSTSLFITFIYACSDEFHQLFIPGRAGQFKDVMIDTSGALIMLIIIYIWQTRKKFID